MDRPPSAGLLISPRIRAHSAFSLVEISLAIGIIAFAFIALLGLLPVGLQTFRSAIDTGNETRIVQSLSSMLLSADYEKIPPMDFGTSKEIYYFDEEGQPTDRESQPRPELAIQRLYATKIFIETPEKIPAKLTQLNHGMNAVIVFANINSPAMKEFESISSLTELQGHLADVASDGGVTELRVHTLLLAKMDGK